MTQDQSWLKISKLTDTVWRIEDAGMVSEYVIMGKDKALLIDCGWGIGDLAKAVKGITSLPLIVINTHGHRDHTSGDYQIGGIQIHEGDIPLLKSAYDPTARSQTLQRFPRESWPPGFSEQAWVHAALPKFTAFKGPLHFDLGGRVVDVIETPGHTPGSVCLYDHKERLLFSGDNVIAGHTLLMMPDSLPLATYAKSVDRLVAMAGQIKEIIPSHGPVPLKPEVLKELQAGIRKVLSGELRGTPEKTFLGSGLACRFGTCGILYKEEKLK